MFRGLIVLYLNVTIILTDKEVVILGFNVIWKSLSDLIE